MEINHEKFSFDAQRKEFYLVQGFRSSIVDRRQARFERHLVWNDQGWVQVADGKSSPSHLVAWKVDGKSKSVQVIRQNLMASPSQVQVIRQNLMASPSQVQVIRQNLMASHSPSRQSREKLMASHSPSRLVAWKIDGKS